VDPAPEKDEEGGDDADDDEDDGDAETGGTAADDDDDADAEDDDENEDAGGDDNEDGGVAGDDDAGTDAAPRTARADTARARAPRDTIKRPTSRNDRAAAASVLIGCPRCRVSRCPQWRARLPAFLLGALTVAVCSTSRSNVVTATRTAQVTALARLDRHSVSPPAPPPDAYVSCTGLHNTLWPVNLAQRNFAVASPPRINAESCSRAARLAVVAARPTDGPALPTD
jgi:hypothetical protein